MRVKELTRSLEQFRLWINLQEKTYLRAVRLSEVIKSPDGTLEMLKKLAVSLLLRYFRTHPSFLLPSCFLPFSVSTPVSGERSWGAGVTQRRPTGSDQREDPEA